MKERIKAIEKYLKFYPRDYEAIKNLTMCECLDLLGMKFPNKVSYFPKVEYSSLLINDQIRVDKKFYITNSTTGYERGDEKAFVVWGEPCGRLAFVHEKYYGDIETEWNEFKNILKSYNPLDYDEINNKYIYNIEDGKRLIADYDNIITTLKENIHKTISLVKLKEKEEELDRLKKEIGV